MSLTFRSRLRRLRFGLMTVLGIEPLGFFIPYRYASGVGRTGYPALLPLFEAAAPAMRGELEGLSEHAPAFGAFSGKAPEPRFGQGWFPTLDAAIAYALVARSGPRRIIEIGSGHSTRFLARAVRDRDLPTTITCIDPAPRANLDGLAVRWVRQQLQGVDRSLFDALEPGDVLFVDSSHVLMPGTDVDLVLNEILPRLRPGVLVHVHDIFLPDPYPEVWTWRGYNEQSALGALIQTGAYEILFASHFVEAHHPEWAARTVVASLPAYEGAPASSLWLLKHR